NPATKAIGFLRRAQNLYSGSALRNLKYGNPAIKEIVKGRPSPTKFCRRKLNKSMEYVRSALRSEWLPGPSLPDRTAAKEGRTHIKGLEKAIEALALRYLEEFQEVTRCQEMSQKGHEFDTPDCDRVPYRNRAVEGREVEPAASSCSSKERPSSDLTADIFELVVDFMNCALLGFSIFMLYRMLK
ncbi:hypothetical protein CEXT_389441, partial [Caerostris extrusa]